MHSIVNRTPKELLNEIILVDNFSNKKDLQQDLNEYIRKFFPNVVSIIRLTHKCGLAGARLAGSKYAKANVLIFLDSHIECSHNWLPPLLQPLIINSNITTTPVVDIINPSNLGYEQPEYFEGFRSGFNWNLEYKEMPRIEFDSLKSSLPFESPVISSGLFAINKEYFWLLDGYDDEVDLWDAEHLELSFKIWMCGGAILQVPCSRIGRIEKNVVTDGRNQELLLRVSLFLCPHYT